MQVLLRKQDSLYSIAKTCETKQGIHAALLTQVRERQNAKKQLIGRVWLPQRSSKTFQFGHKLQHLNLTDLMTEEIKSFTDITVLERCM